MRSLVLLSNALLHLVAVLLDAGKQLLWRAQQQQQASERGKQRASWQQARSRYEGALGETCSIQRTRSASWDWMWCRHHTSAADRNCNQQRQRYSCIKLAAIVRTSHIAVHYETPHLTPYLKQAAPDTCQQHATLLAVHKDLAHELVSDERPHVELADGLRSEALVEPRHIATGGVHRRRGDKLRLL